MTIIVTIAIARIRIKIIRKTIVFLQINAKVIILITESNIRN